MEPATIYAITVTLVGIGHMPAIQVEKLPHQWTMADCIKDHEKKLASRPSTKVLCVSRDRFKSMFPKPKRYLISIRAGSEGIVDSTEWRGTMGECQDLVSQFADRVSAFCVETPKLDKRRKARHG